MAKASKSPAPRGKTGARPGRAKAAKPPVQQVASADEDKGPAGATQPMVEAVRQAAKRRRSLRDTLAPGQDNRLAVVALARALAEFPDIVVHKHPFFGRMRIDLSEVVSQEIYLYDWFEEDLTHFFLQALRPGDTFYDVGAHLGYFSLLASRCVGPRGQVIAFEPAPRTFQHLLGPNIEPLANVRRHRWAVWKEAASLTFRDYGRTHSAYNTLGEPKIAPLQASRLTATEIEVKAVALDALPRKAPPPDVVKVDVESAELQVLQGMSGILAEQKPVVTLEMGDQGGAEQGLSPTSAEVLAAIEAADYELYEPRDGQLIAHAIQSEPYAYMNMVCLPKEGHLRQRLQALIKTT
ncbi:MAG: FkbM family methyltransferase [Pseudomonadota bacterium]